MVSTPPSLNYTPVAKKIEGDSVSTFDAADFERALFTSLALPGGGKAVVTEQRPSLINSTELYLVVEVPNPDWRHFCPQP